MKRGKNISPFHHSSKAGCNLHPIIQVDVVDVAERGKNEYMVFCSLFTLNWNQAAYTVGAIPTGGRIWKRHCGMDNMLLDASRRLDSCFCEAHNYMVAFCHEFESQMLTLGVQFPEHG